MKISMKRLAALALALVMVVGLLPVMNNAVNAVDVTGLTDGTIGVSYVNAGQPDNNNSGWTASGNAITGKLLGVKRGAIYMNATSTLTITNNKSGAANLSFDYSITVLNGSATIDGQSATSGSFNKKLDSGESVVVVLSGTRGNKDNSASISITNLILASASNDPVTTTFEAPAFGSYTVVYGGDSLTVAAGTASQTATNLPSVSYTLTANPGDGYKMVGWYNVTTDTYLGTELTYTGSFEEACTVKAVIVPEDSAVFKVGESNYFSDLNEAVAYAQAKGETQVTLVQSGTLAAGDYTVPAGITLLIPMDTEYTPTRTDDEDFGVAPEYTTDYTTPYAYLTMSMADGAKLTVNGTLDIESKHTTYQGGKATGGRPCGAYGAVYMNPEASITVNNGGNLYAWGYIYGEGNVTANSGAKVYEIMQVTDFPGGSNMSQFVDTDPTYDVDGDDNPSNDYFKTFPFSQYYVQNIEVALTLKAGAAEYVYITMTAGGQSMGLPVRFIGEGGMFVPGEGGTIVKDYDPSTDRLNVTVNGDASMAGIALDLTGTKYEGAVEDVLGTSKVDSASFILTLNGNITINIASGTTTVKQDLSLLPGVEINIAKDATLVVAERSYADGEYDNLTVYGTYTGYNIYVWDLDNWGNFIFKNKPLVALTYSPTTGRYVRTADDLKDVRIDINGTVICEGYIYSTVNFDDEEWVPVPGAGAAVISTGKTGTLVLQNGPGPEDMAYCLDGYSDKDSAVFVDSVWLLNGDGTFVLTEGCEPGTTYNYCDVHDLWYTEGHDNCVVINTVEITWIVNGVGAPEEYLLGDVPSYKGGIPTKPADGCTVYTFAGWAETADGEVLTELPAVTGEAAYFAIFTESEDHDWVNIWSDYNGNNTHTDYYECENCDASYTVVENCTNGKDDDEHECDNCFGELTTCNDGNNDHNCDICGDELSVCEDGNNDHYCDVCGNELSVCEDGNNDHHCDVCGNELSVCEDGNNDHYCDVCGNELSVCYDNDDHYCDTCGNKVSDCTPGTPEENVLRNPDCEPGEKQIIVCCSLCGAELENYTEEISALGHGYSAGWEYVQVDNDVHQVWCKDCYGYTYNDGHDYVNHVCDDCGWTERMSVQFFNGQTPWTDTMVPYGDTLVIAGMPVPAAPTGYKFAGWYTEDGVHVVHGMTITEDVVAYATWAKQTFTVTWIVDGVSTEEVYEYGATPSFKGNTNKAQVGCTTYTFDGWDKDIAPVTGDVIYTAQYESGISHTGELKYTHVDEWSHKVTYGCCGAVVHEAEKHQQLQDGYCVCGDVLIMLSVSDVKIFGEELESSMLFIYVKAGSTYTLDLAPADGWQKACVEIYDYSTYTVDTTVNATQLVLGPEYTSAFNENLMISISGYWDIIYDLNGGNITDELKDFIPEGAYDPENGILTMYMPSNAWVNFNILKEMYFVREGYTLIGVTDGQTTYTGDEDIAPNGEDLHLTLIWKADHVCSENLTEVEAVEPDCDTNGVKAYWSCSCGKYYADANASTEITDLAAWKNGDGKIEKLGHGHTAGLYYEENDEDTHNIYCNDCDEAIKGNVKCTDTIGDGDHKCDFCPNDNITGHIYDADTHKCECGAVETFTVTWLFDGGVMDAQTKQMLINEGFTVTDTFASSTFPYGDFAPYAPGVTKDGYTLAGYTDQYGKFNEGQEIFTLAEDMTFTMVWAAKTYTLTVETPNGNVDLFVPYGTNLLEALAQAAAAGKIPAKGDRIRVNDEFANGVYYINGDYYIVSNSFEISEVKDDSTMPAENITVSQAITTYGWSYDLDYVRYHDPIKGQLGEGWHYIEEDYDDVPGGAWYYFESCEFGAARVEGLTRVPYNTELGYGPNAEDVAYEGDSFIDKDTALFYFDENGKFLSSFSGLVGDSYVLNGVAAWHVGLVQIGEDYYYFKGDKVNGGNIMVTGCDYYLSRNNTSFNMVVGGIYTFDNDGKMQWKFHGIEESDLFEGKRFYIGGRLMVGAGLQDIKNAGETEWRYFYVDSYGQLILDAEYYVGANNLGVEKGIYYFDAEGFMVIPEPEPGKEGLHFEEGKWYYYVDGAKAYCAGLIEIDGNWVYVKSDGSLATGAYYVTNTNGHETIASGTKCLFDENGFMQEALNGIIDGYYYVDNQIAYAAGLIEIDGIYYYVRSNGQIVTGTKYWITNVGDTGIEPGYYEFDENGIMAPAFTGVKDGFYYENGAIAYAAGLVEIEPGKYVYVRSNGQIATGKYWITNTHGYLEQGFYTFGEDGLLTVN